MDLNEVDVVGLEFLETAVDKLERRAVRVVEDAAVLVAVLTDFGREIELVPSCFKRFADVFFTEPIRGRSVDEVDAVIEDFV